MEDRRQNTCKCGTRLDSRGHCPACDDRYYHQQRHSTKHGSSSSSPSRPTSSTPSPRSSLDGLSHSSRAPRSAARVLGDSLATEDGRSIFSSASFRRDFDSRRSSSSSSSRSGRGTPSPSSSSTSLSSKRYSLIEEQSGPTSAPGAASYSYGRGDARDRVGRGSLDAARPRLDDSVYSPLSAGFASLNRRGTFAQSRPLTQSGRTSSGVDLAAGMFGGAA